MQKTIPIVDDDKSIRGMVRSVLSREGFEVEVAASGNEAIARMGRKHYDVLVLDVMMDDGSGADVLETLAMQRPGVKCVVVISATLATRFLGDGEYCGDSTVVGAAWGWG